MATNNRGGNRSGNRGGGNRSRGRNNNPEGYNQYSGITGRARENPIAAAAAVGGAVAAGVFLWSRRNQISDQIGTLSDQISEWREGSNDEFGSSDATGSESFMASSGGRNNSSGTSRGRKSQTEIAEEALTLKETGKATA